MKRQLLNILLIAGLIAIVTSCNTKSSYKTLIITGRNTSNWKESSSVLKQILDGSGLFSCEIATNPKSAGDTSSFEPDFSKYKLVVIDYNVDSWSEKTKTAFLDFVRNGGGVIVYQGASSSFPDWKEYNEICGLGGWGNRSEKDGPYVYYRNNELVTDSSAGIAGSYGKLSEYEVRVRNLDHPVTRGLPVRWMHGYDVLYARLRGPAKNMEILATAYSDTAGGGSGRNEPVLMAITYGKGRIFHTTMGILGEGGGPAVHCAGFIVTLQRGAEWAVTGNVTQAVPNDFPNAAGIVLRPDYKEITLEDDFANIVNYEISKSTKYLTDLQARIRKASGDAKTLLKYEKMMVSVLKNSEATIDSKKLILRELSWMGTDYCIASIKELVKNEELKHEAEFALERLNVEK